MKKKIIKLIIIILSIVAVSVGIYFILKAFDLLNIERLRVAISKRGIWAYVIFFVLQVINGVFLSTIPATSMAFILLGVALFGANWKCLVVNLLGTFVASGIMYVIGRFGGYKLTSKIFGKEDTDKAIKVINDYGTAYFPCCMIFPAFPDDALCGVAGIIKMKLWFYIPSVVIGRGIGTATIVMGLTLLPQDLVSHLEQFDWNFIFSHLFDYLTMITVLVFWALLFIGGTYLINRIVLKKKKNKKGQVINVNELTKTSTCEEKCEDERTEK